jgi:membrane-bound serine protease (ClpP class)
VPLWVSFVLLAAGILAIYVEIFVPAAGLIGLAGGGMIVASVVLGYVYHDPITGTIFLFVSLVVVPTAIALGLKVFPKTPVGRRLILGPTPGAGSDSGGEQQADADTPVDRLSAEPGVGDEGTAVTDLRPSGTGRFEQRKLSVVTSGEYIERGAPVRIVRVEGNRIVVRQARPTDS